MQATSMADMTSPQHHLAQRHISSEVCQPQLFKAECSKLISFQDMATRCESYESRLDILETCDRTLQKNDPGF